MTRLAFPAACAALLALLGCAPDQPASPQASAPLAGAESPAGTTADSATSQAAGQAAGEATGQAADPATGDTAARATAQAATPAAAGAGRRPNILLIVADDLGFADLGAFGGEIPTPTLDGLARDGMMLTQFYAAMACSPTRAMLFSGTDAHIAGLGVMSPPRNPPQQGQPGYEAHLNFRVASLASLLRDAGYRTYMTGKWHLGAEVDTGPAARGFDRSFVSIDGAAHLGGLSWNGPGDAPYRDGETLMTVDDSFYSTREYTERMIDYIESDRGRDEPFFAYLAYTAPHWPLQAPPESIARFEGAYDEGYDVLYERRLERQKALGLAPADFDGLAPTDDSPPWVELDAESRRVEARKMEIYAAMVADLDAYIGEVIAYLDSIGELDRTFIFFMSDNGPEGARRDLVAPLSEWVEECCNNAYENFGAAGSYVMYGSRWARAGAVPFRDWKGSGFEGGFRVPAFVRWPGNVPAGSRSNAFATVLDLMPTFLSLAGTTHPGPEYRGRDVAPPRGHSLLPLVTGEAEAVHDADEYVGWELNGHRAIRQGDWKIVWDPREAEPAWKLFNLARDPVEAHDLAATEPDRLAAMTALWQDYVTRNGVILAE